MAQELHVFTPADAETNALQGIRTYLEQRAQDDPLFALKYLTSGKTLIGAVRYLAHKNIDNVLLKGEKANGKTFDFAMNSDAADNELAYQYFMDDTLNYEKGAEPAKTETQKKVRTPKAVKSAKAQKPATNKQNTSTKKPQNNVKPSTQPLNTKSATAQAAKPAAPEEFEIDLFAGMFD